MSEFRGATSAGAFEACLARLRACETLDDAVGAACEICGESMLGLLRAAQAVPRDADRDFAPLPANAVGAAVAPDDVEAADAAVALLGELCQVAESRLEADGWEATDAVASCAGGIVYRHRVTRARSEHPTLSDDERRGWRGRLLQQAAVLATPSSLDGATVLWAVRVVALDAAERVAVLDCVTMEEDGCDGPSAAPAPRHGAHAAAAYETATPSPATVTMRGLYRGPWRGLGHTPVDQAVFHGSTDTTTATTSTATTIASCNLRESASAGGSGIGASGDSSPPQLESFAHTTACGLVEAYAPRGAARVLVVGLGCGSLARFLSQTFGAGGKGGADGGEGGAGVAVAPGARPREVVIVERSLAVAAALRHWGNVPPGCTLHRVESYREWTEAQKVADESSVSFDAVIVDDGDEGDARAVRGCLAPDGVLVISRTRAALAAASFGAWGDGGALLREQKLREGDEGVDGGGDGGRSRCAAGADAQAANASSAHKDSDVFNDDADDDDDGDGDVDDAAFAWGCPAELSTDGWAAATGSVFTGALDVARAQRTRAVVVPSLVTIEEADGVREAADRARAAGAGVEVRSPPGAVCDPPDDDVPVWSVVHLNTRGMLDELLPGMREKVLGAARAADAAEGWGLLSELGDSDVRVRVAEFHRYAPGGALPDPRHYDLDSLVTVDVMLSRPGVDFQGGVLHTDEADGVGLQPVSGFGFGDAAVFVSHKFHCVTPVTSGVRNVLVVELWRGEERRCPHRCGIFHGRCPLDTAATTDGGSKGDSAAEHPSCRLPFRLGAAVPVVHRDADQESGGVSEWTLLWQPASDEAAEPAEPPDAQLRPNDTRDPAAEPHVDDSVAGPKCPNSSNPHHKCTAWCAERWGVDVAPAAAAAAPPSAPRAVLGALNGASDIVLCMFD